MFTFLYLRLRLRLILMIPNREKRNDKMYRFLTEWPCRYLAMGWGCNATATQWHDLRRLQLDRAINATSTVIRLMTDITHLATRCQEGYVFDGICGMTMLKEFRWGNGKAGFDPVLYLQHDDPGFTKPMTHNDYECPTMMATILSGSYGHILEMREMERQGQPITQQSC